MSIFAKQHVVARDNVRSKAGPVVCSGLHHARDDGFHSRDHAPGLSRSTRPDGNQTQEKQTREWLPHSHGGEAPTCLAEYSMPAAIMKVSDCFPAIRIALVFGLEEFRK
jgi:hypothetical protein